MRNNKTKQTKRKQQTKTKRNENISFDELSRTKIPKSLMHASPFPMEMTRTLTFFEPSLVIQDASNPFKLREWRINSVYDPDPLIGGGTVAGYHQLVAIYDQWKVINFKVRYEVAGNEPNVPVIFGLIFRDQQPSTIISAYADAQNALEIAPTTGPNIVGQTTGMDVYRSPWYKVKPSSIMGNPLTYNGAIEYQGSTSANPTQVIFLGFVALSIGSTINLTNGCILTIYMEFTTRFYSLKGILE
jgi:hypothetical protein